MTSDLPDIANRDEPDGREQPRPHARSDDWRQRVAVTVVALVITFIASFSLLAPSLVYLLAGQLDLLDGCGFKSWRAVCDPDIPIAITVKTALFIAVGAAVPMLVVWWQDALVARVAESVSRVFHSYLPTFAVLYLGGALLGFITAFVILRVLPGWVDLLWPQLRLSENVTSFGGKWVVGLYVSAIVGGGFSLVLTGTMIALAKLGIIDPRARQLQRCVAIPLVLLVSAVVTVTLDPAFALIALPLYAAYELGLLLAARFTYQRALASPT